MRAGRILSPIEQAFAALAALRPDERAAVARSPLIDQAQLRLELLRARDDEIRAVAAEHYGSIPNPAAALAEDLANYISTTWRHHQDDPELPESFIPRRRALHRIARLTRGESISARHVARIIFG